MSVNDIVRRIRGTKEIYIHAIIIVVSILCRLPFLRTFNLVTYDGTYYLNQARSLLAGVKMAGAFPIGYPAFVALFFIIIRETLVAAQIVSFLASVGSAIVLYLLAKHYVRKEYAVLCALLLCVNPLFIRYSLFPMSEMLYVFWVLLSLLYFARKRYVCFGLAIGLAAVTRPEAILIVAILGLSTLRNPRAIASIVISFVFVFSINVIVLSKSQERLVLLPKTENIGTSARSTSPHEISLDFKEREQGIAELKSKNPDKNPVVDYFQRLPRECLLLAKHLSPFLLILSLTGIYRKRTIAILAALVFFLIFPLATPRSRDRFIIPYIPILLLYVVIGFESIRSKRIRSTVFVLVLLSAVSLPVIDRGSLRLYREASHVDAKEAANVFRDRVDPGNKIADRKPYFAFYAGGEYVTIPLAPYDPTVQFLYDSDVKYLSLHRQTIEVFRPALIPLLDDKAVLAGEMRFRQVYFSPTGQMILEKTRTSEPLIWEKLQGCGGDAYAPCWLPGGDRVAFRSSDKMKRGSVCIGSSGEGEAKKLFEENTSGDQISVSPDGTYLAFSSAPRENMDIFLFEFSTQKMLQLTTSEGNGRSPSWSADGSLIAFSSDRTGQNEIWMKLVRTAEENQLTSDGGNAYPAISPTGDRIAWIKKAEGIVILDQRTGAIVRADVPKSADFAPAWSPDGKYIAVTAGDWGSWDIYLLTSDGSQALLLTKDLSFQGMPSWRSDGKALAISSDHDGESAIWILSGLDPYLKRLDNPLNIRTYRK